jgi:hypothetical protein
MLSRNLARTQNHLPQVKPRPESRKAVERREQLARARAARARRDPGVGLLLIWIGVATSMVIFLVFVVLWLEGVNLGKLAQRGLTPGGRRLAGAGHARPPRTRRRRRAHARRGCRAPVVYLRPFGADGAEIAKRMSSRAHRAGRTLREDLRGAAGTRAAQDRAVRCRREPGGAPAAARCGAHVRGRRGLAGGSRRADRPRSRRGPARRGGGTALPGRFST